MNREEENTMKSYICICICILCIYYLLFLYFKCYCDKFHDIIMIFNYHTLYVLRHSLFMKSKYKHIWACSIVWYNNKFTKRFFYYKKCYSSLYIYINAIWTHHVVGSRYMYYYYIILIYIVNSCYIRYYRFRMKEK